MLITWQTSVTPPSAQAPAAFSPGDWDAEASRIDVTQSGTDVTADSAGEFTINASPSGVIIQEGDVYNGGAPSTAENIVLPYAGGTSVDVTDLRDDSITTLVIPTLTAGTLDQGPTVTEGPNYDALTISGSNVTFRGSTTPQYSADDSEGSFTDFEGDESTTQIPTGFVRVAVREGVQEVFTPSIEITEDLGISANLFLPGDDGGLFETLGTSFFTDEEGTIEAGDGDTVENWANRVAGTSGTLTRGAATGDLPILRIPGGTAKPYLELGAGGTGFTNAAGLISNITPTTEGTLIIHANALVGATHAPRIMSNQGGTNEVGLFMIDGVTRAYIGQSTVQATAGENTTVISDQVPFTFSIRWDGAGNYKMFIQENDEGSNRQYPGTYTGTPLTGEVFELISRGAVYAIQYIDRQISLSDLQALHEYWKTNLSQDGA